MKIVVIHGQNHKGSTYNMAKLLIDAIDCEKQVDEIFLPRDLNHFCIGCYNCVEDESKCPYYSEKNAIMKKVEQADLLIMTTPNYCMAPSGPMKSFIDLTFTYWMSHKPRKCMFSKRAVVLSTTAGMGANQAIKPVARALFYWGIPFVKSYGVAVQAKSWDEVAPKKKDKITNHMSKIAKKLVSKYQKGKAPAVSLKTKFIFMMMSKMQKAGMGSGDIEREYWSKQGWLDGGKPWK